MKIVVAVKQVPERDAAVRLRGTVAVWMKRDLNYTMNEPDAYALEEALQLKETSGGEVVVVCAGPERVQSTLREALAKGADRAVHVVRRKTWVIVDAFAGRGAVAGGCGEG